MCMRARVCMCMWVCVRACVEVSFPSIFVSCCTAPISKLKLNLGQVMTYSFSKPSLHFGRFAPRWGCGSWPEPCRTLRRFCLLPGKPGCLCSSADHATSLFPPFPLLSPSSPCLLLHSSLIFPSFFSLPPSVCYPITECVCVFVLLGMCIRPHTHAYNVCVWKCTSYLGKSITWQAKQNVERK